MLKWSQQRLKVEKNLNWFSVMTDDASVKRMISWLQIDSYNFPHTPFSFHQVPTIGLFQ